MNEFENTEWVDSRERLRPPPKLAPQVDEVISQIVGRKIFAYDPRLTKLIVKWKKGKSPDSMEPDNFLQDEKKIKELREVLSKPLE